MSSIPTSLSEVCLTLFRPAMSPGPWPFSRPQTQIFPLPKHPIKLTRLNPIRSDTKQQIPTQPMKRIRGIRLRHRVTTLFRYVFRRNRTRPRTFSGYQRLDPSTCKTKRISRLFSCLKKKAKSLCFSNPSGVPGRAYSLLEEDKAVEVVPKGQMAVYVGQKDGGDFHRVLVPVMYFNHPLFGKLLREAEEEYGFDHPGGITIPCRISEFESVQTRIAAGRGCRKLMTRKMGF